MWFMMSDDMGNMNPRHEFICIYVECDCLWCWLYRDEIMLMLIMILRQVSILMVPNAFFAIIRHEVELRKRFQHWGLREIERPWSTSTSFFVRCSSCDHRLVLFLRFEYDLCTLRGPLCYYVHIHLLHLSSTISFFVVKFNLNRSLVL